MLLRWRTWAGVVCLVVGSMAQLAQYLVTPVAPGATAAEQVSQAAAHMSAMRVAVLLDVPLVLIIPAVLYVGMAAGARRSALAAVGTVLAFLPMLAAEFLLAGDALLVEAARQPDRAAAVALVQAYQSNGTVAGLVLFYLAGHLVSFVLLAVALWRARTVPRWAAVALGSSPVVEFIGGGAGVDAVMAVSYALVVAAFGACAVALVRTGAEPVTASLPAVARAAAAAR